MDQTFEEICNSLDAVGDAVTSLTSENRTLTAVFGWNCPAVTRQDLARMAYDLAERIREAAPVSISPDDTAYISAIPNQLNDLKVHTVPQLFNGGNVTSASAAFIGTIKCLESQLEPYVIWQRLDDPNSLPPKLARKVRAYTAQLARLGPKLEGLQEKVARILDAHDAAESLPTDMEALQEARAEIQRMAEAARNLHDDIQSRDSESGRILKLLHDREDEATKVVDKCEEAYRITTTKGLAAAFDERAYSLKMSMRYWVGGLSTALVAGGALGAHRLKILSAAVSVQDPQWGAVLMQLALSVLSIGGPLWFAWLATKQIGQRFKLAEDYAFKASVAKAYEGYRKEAARIDELFEARLFSSALSRLEEAPLRLVEGTTHGSPWHEFMSSSAFQEALATIPEFKETMADILKKGADAVKAKMGASEGKKKDAQKEPEEADA